MSEKILKLAAVADTHCHEGNRKALRSLFRDVNAAADIFLLCGDLTDTGLAQEAEILAKELNGAVKLPIVAVLGNHDFESNMPNKVKEILSEQAQVCFLEGNMCEKSGLGFVGIKGFGGGFGKYQLQSWGEKVLKNFVQEAIEESLLLGRALSQSRTAVNIALMHYSPIKATVEGEPCEIIPFLGSSHLEGPLDQYGVHSVFHGHAHNGSAQGYTSRGIPVFNASMPLLQKKYPDRPPYVLTEVILDKV